MIELLLPMDPQNANNLDPKLKETYDRVMGTNTPPAAQAAPAAVTPQPVSPTTAPPAAQPAPADPAAAAAQNQGIPTPAYTADTLSFQAAIQQPAAAAAQTQTPLGVIPTQPQSGLLKILYIIGGVVFFIVYTIVWVKIFNLPLPF